MKTETVWSESVPSKDSFSNTVFDLTFRSDGTQLLVAVGSRILVYDCAEGDLLHSLKGHRDYVYAVAYSRDGKRFASGGADKTIIIWTNKCEGILKYSHNDSIQCLSYNPITQQLASATQNDFGLWSPEQKSVQKFKVSAKVLCTAWTNDGQYLALGQFNGHISIRDKSGNEKVRIERSAPIWTMQWSPIVQTTPTTATLDKLELLAVGCWDQTLSFYELSGAQHNKDRSLQYDPTSLCYYGDGEYILIGGSNRKVSMYTKDGVFLKQIAEKEDWVWSVKARPKHKYLALGCNDGKIGMYQTVFSTVHGLYQDRYAHRDTMTDVIIQHLITEQKVRIKTRDYVKKIAVYRARLAVQLPDRVLIYETIHEDPYDMHYRLKEKIVKQLDCNLLVVTSNNIILCQEKKLQLYNFKGRKVREWVLEAIIRYIRVVGGPSGREGLLIGLKNGCVYKIFIDNRFPVKLIQHVSPIRCLDLSASRKKLAVVDENSKVFVYDLLTSSVLFEESNANSVAWNTDMEEMFCYSGNGQLCIKTGDFPIHKQALQGFVVGFKGSKIFCLHYLSMQTIDVPQSASLYRYLEQNDYLHAYQVACLGVTDTDWRELALQALTGLSLDIARKAFIRIRDVRYIELLNRIEIARRAPNHNETIFRADIQAFQGEFAEAAKLYVKAGQRKKAIEMYLDLRDWEKAKELVEQLQAAGESTSGLNLSSGMEQKQQGGVEGENGVSMLDLLKRQATWLLETNDNKSAAEMYWAAKEYSQAIIILGDNHWWDDLIEKVRQLNIKLHKKHLQVCAAYFRAANHHRYAAETYLKLDDYKALLELHVEQHKWDEAFLLVKGKPEYAQLIYEPYAEWLAIHDRFDEAQQAYKQAGKPEQSLHMLSQLTHNAVVENRYADAGYYYWLLATEVLKNINTNSEGSGSGKLSKLDKSLLNQFYDYYNRSEIYYAYHNIYRYTDEPFTSLLPDALFQTSQYILNNTKPNPALIAFNSEKDSNSSAGTPYGVSKVYCLFALAKQSKILGAYKLARQAYSKLLALKMPAAWRDQVEMACLTIRTKPYNDKEDLLPVCYRCSTSNPLLSSSGDKCMNCGHLFVRSFCSFEPLPLVEFKLEAGISEEEAKKYIEMDYSEYKQAQAHIAGESSGGKGGGGGAQTLNFDSGGEEGGVDGDDLFHQQLMSLEPNPDTGVYPDLVCNQLALIQMKREEVFIRRFHQCAAIRTQYYRSVIPDLPVALCENCNHFFHEEDYEFHVLQKGNCPFCRIAVKREKGEGQEEEEEHKK